MEKFENITGEPEPDRTETFPEMIFFDPDDIAEEADFIRVDDLFRMENAVPAGPVLFTMFPRRAGQYIAGPFIRVLQRTLILTGLRLERPAIKTRVRPRFVQWLSELSETDDAEALVREFRADLEIQADLYRDLEDGERFWADSCFVCPENDRITDDMISRMAARLQKQAAGEEK